MTGPDMATPTPNPQRVLILLASGAEEMEVVITADVLRRAGLEVTLAGIEGKGPVRCSRGVVLVPDCELPAVRGTFELIVLPGGAEGARRLGESAQVGALLAEQDRQQRLIGAICAAPAALARHGIGKGKALTSHPSVAAGLHDFARYREDRVVQDGNLVTSRGPGTAFEFALSLVARLLGQPAADALRAPMLA
jgi:protein DJ-1